MTPENKKTVILNEDVKELLNLAHAKLIKEFPYKKRPSDEKVIKIVLKFYLESE